MLNRSDPGRPCQLRDTYTRIAKSGNFRRGMENQVGNAYKQSLGMQQITVSGVSTKTNFARVMVEADYQMKLMGIGLKAPPAGVKITSFIEKATPNSVAKSSLQRWFFSLSTTASQSMPTEQRWNSWKPSPS